MLNNFLNFQVIGSQGQSVQHLEGLCLVLPLCTPKCLPPLTGLLALWGETAPSLPQLSSFSSSLKLCAQPDYLYSDSFLRQGMVGKHGPWRKVGLGPHSMCSINICWLPNSYWAATMCQEPKMFFFYHSLPVVGRIIILSLWRRKLGLGPG